jgi:hypothetical protein
LLCSVILFSLSSICLTSSVRCSLLHDQSWHEISPAGVLEFEQKAILVCGEMEFSGT